MLVENLQNVNQLLIKLKLEEMNLVLVDLVKNISIAAVLKRRSKTDEGGNIWASVG